ncbi:MAG: serine/threonine protein kinase [Planctomycetia bacterium]|nr:serine/threonine protein kinase [Planctomycetia bacterium]
MNQCPTDSMLTQVLTDILPENEQGKLDEHLSRCPTCRERLEAVAQVTEFGSVFGSVSSQPPTSSFHLKRVMDQLITESSQSVALFSTPASSEHSKATLPVLQPTLLPGYLGRLGNIQIRRVIGRGGMGVVFEGLDSILNRTVAVKVLSPHLLERPEAKNRFVREAQSAAALTHENVVAIHAISEADGIPFLVLQYVDGESLAERLTRQKVLPFEEVLRIGQQVARGLSAAHDRGMVHRDIKPGNILLDSETGNARITDFGLAKHLGNESLTRVGMLAGTPAYMSPEQATDSALDARSDLFSLGVVLYQASSGELPFKADSPFVLLNQIRSANEKPLHEINPELPEWFCSIVHSLLRKEPENRISSAAELADLLEQRNSILPVRTSANNSRRTWNPVILISTLLLSGICIAAIIFLVQRQQEVLTSHATQAEAVIQGFQIVGDERKYPSLAEAIDAVSEKGTIIIHGDGPFSTPTIRIENKNMTVRAAPGSHPRFIPETTGNGNFRQFLSTNSDLTLEGIEIYWPLKAPVTKMDDPSQRAILYSSNRKLSILNCRIVSGDATACIGSTGQDVVIERCHIVSPNGCCLAWKVSSSPVHLENNVIECRAIMNIGRPPNMANIVRKGIYLARNIFSGERVLNVFVELNPRFSFPVKAFRNIVDCTHPLTVLTLPRNPFDINHPETIRDLGKAVVSWSEDSNVYRKHTDYLSALRTSQIKMAELNISQSAELKNVAQWQEFWNMKDTRSIEGDIQFQTRTGPTPLTVLQLKQIANTSGPLMKEMGPSTDLIGPGEAYHQWCKSNLLRN